MNHSSNRDGSTLTSWKEIAQYLGREVRTVQRWELFEGLPVHRHHHAKLGSVYAYRHEIDAWRQARSSGPDGRRIAPIPATEIKGIRVSPFANQNPDPNNEYISDGLTDDILTHLSRVVAQQHDAFMPCLHAEFRFQEITQRVHQQWIALE